MQVTTPIEKGFTSHCPSCSVHSSLMGISYASMMHSLQFVKIIISSSDLSRRSCSQSNGVVMQAFEQKSCTLISRVGGGSSIPFTSGDRNENFKPTHLGVFRTTMLRMYGHGRERPGRRPYILRVVGLPELLATDS